ncbi:retrovirus-related pol polyprotein from transposon TNT 1-94 [Tanacetum coccineum]
MQIRIRRAIGVQNIGNGNVGSSTALRSDQGEGMLLIFRLSDLDEIESQCKRHFCGFNLQQVIAIGVLKLTKLPSMIQTDQLRYTTMTTAMIMRYLICLLKRSRGGTVDQHPATVEETRAYFESLYNNLALEVEKVNSVLAIWVYGDLQWGNMVDHQGRNSCFVRNLDGVDLLQGNRSTNLYTINLHEMASASPICLMARATSTKSCQISERARVVPLVSTKKQKASTHQTSAIFEAENDREDIRKLGAKGGIGFFIGYSVNSCAYRVNNRRTKKIMETMNVSFDELSAMAFEQSSSKPGLQSMTSGQISSGLDLTYAPSTITTQKPTEGDLDVLFEAMYDDFIGGQPSSAPRTTPAAQAPQVLQTPSATTTTADSSPTPIIASSQATDLSNTSQDVDELTMEPRNVKEAMTDPAWIESMQEELLQFKRLDNTVIRNKSSSVVEGTARGRNNFEESFAPVARMEELSG